MNLYTFTLTNDLCVTDRNIVHYRPYKCETCGKTFGRNTLRQAHMRVRK